MNTPINKHLNPKNMSSTKQQIIDKWFTPKKPKTKRNNLEKLTQDCILEYLTAKKIFHWRNNSGAIKKDKHFIQFGKVGSADIFALSKSTFYAIEVKSPTGTQSPAQKKFQSDVEVSGGIYILARRLEDVQKYL